MTSLSRVALPVFASLSLLALLDTIAHGADAIVLSGHTQGVCSVAFAGGSGVLASTGEDGTVRLWDATTAKELCQLTGHDGPVLCAAVSPDGSLLATGEMYKRVKIWNLAERKERITLEAFEERLYDLAFAPDGKTLATACRDNKVRVFNTADWALLATLPHDYEAQAVAFSPADGTLASADGSGAIHLWDLTSTTARLRIEAGAGVTSLAFSNDGKRLLAAIGQEKVAAWKAASGKSCDDFKPPAIAANALRFSRDGTLLAVGTQDNDVVLLDALTGKIRTTLRGHDRPVLAVAFSPDGKTLASASYDSTIRLWPLPVK